VTALDRVPSKTPLIFTGHSLGAGVALLCASVVEFPRELRRKLGRRRPRAVAFAPPPVLLPRRGRRRFDHCLESYFVQNDVVPDLSLASVTDLARKLDALDAALAPKQRFDFLLRRLSLFFPLGGGDDSRARTQQLDRELVHAVDAALARRHHHHHHHPHDDDTTAAPLTVPGALFRLDRRGVCRRLSPPHRPEIRLHDASFLDHFLPTIDAAIDKWCHDDSPGLEDDDDDSDDDHRTADLED